MGARLQTGDLVVVISGKNKGKQGKIARILADYDRVVVEGVNLIKRHLKPDREEPAGRHPREGSPPARLKVMPVDPKTGKPTRVRFKSDAKGNKVRVAVKSGEELPNKAREASASNAGGAE